MSRSVVCVRAARCRDSPTAGTVESDCSRGLAIPVSLRCSNRNLGGLWRNYQRQVSGPQWSGGKNPVFPLLPESRDGILLMRSDLLPRVFSEHLLSSSPQADGSRDLRGPGACTESGNANYADVECRSYSDGFGLETSPGLMPLAPHKSFTPSEPQLPLLENERLCIHSKGFTVSVIRSALFLALGPQQGQELPPRGLSSRWRGGIKNEHVFKKCSVL